MKPNFRQLVEAHEANHITETQRQYIRDLMEKKGITVSHIIDDGFPPLEKLTRGTASELLDYLLSQKEMTGYSREYSGPDHIGDLLN